MALRFIPLVLLAPIPSEDGTYLSINVSLQVFNGTHAAPSIFVVDFENHYR